MSLPEEDQSWSGSERNVNVEATGCAGALRMTPRVRVKVVMASLRGRSWQVNREWRGVEQDAFGSAALVLRRPRMIGMSSVIAAG